MSDDCSRMLSHLNEASFPTSCCSKDQESGTMATIWKWIVWDLNCLYNNRYSELDPFWRPFPKAGQSILPNCMICWVYTLLGDMDFYQKDLGTPHQSNMDPNPACAFCTADKSGNNWFDFRPLAPWRSSAPRAKATEREVCKLEGFTT